jgi:hypothetical protein
MPCVEDALHAVDRRRRVDQFREVDQRVLLCRMSGNEMTPVLIFEFLRRRRQAREVATFGGAGHTFEIVPARGPDKLPGVISELFVIRVATPSRDQNCFAAVVRRL